MQTIELRATAPFEQFQSDVVELQSLNCKQDKAVNLDEALATVVQAIRQSKLPGGMDALGTLLAYMETLEKTQHAGTSKNDNWITLSSPVTMTV